MLKLLFAIFLVSCSSIEKPVNPSIEVGLKKNIWTKNLDLPYSSNGSHLSHSYPAMDEEAVYVPAISGTFMAYDLATGRLKWSFKEDTTLSGAPALYKNLVIYGSMLGRIYAREKVRGKLEWAIDLGAPMESSPVVAGDKIYFHLRNHVVVAIDASTGKVLWSYRRTIANTTTLQKVSRPVIDGQKLFVGSADGYVLCLSSEDGNLQWETKLTTSLKFIDVDVDIYVEDKKVYAGSAADQLHVINQEDGTILQKIPLNISYGALKADERIYLGTFQGEVAVLYHHDIVNRVKLGNSGIGSMKWWKGRLVVMMMDGSAFLLDPKTLKTIDRFNFGSSQSGFYGDVAVFEDYLALMSSSSRLYVFN